LHAVQAIFFICLAVVACGHGHEGAAIAEVAVNHRCPGVHFAVVHWQLWAKAEVKKFVLA